MPIYKCTLFFIEWIPIKVEHDTVPIMGTSASVRARIRSESKPDNPTTKHDNPTSKHDNPTTKSISKDLNNCQVQSLLSNFKPEANP